MTSAYFWTFLTPPPPFVSICQTLNTPLSNDVRPWHTPLPLLRTNFYVNKRKVSNKYNYTKFFLKKIQFQIQRLSVLVYAFVAIAEKFPFLLTSSLVKPPLPLMSENVSICQTLNTPPK